MEIRIIAATQGANDSVDVTAALFDASGEAANELVRCAFQFENGKSEISAVIEMQNSLQRLVSRRQQQGQLIAALSGKAYPAKTPAEAKSFLGIS